MWSESKRSVVRAESKHPYEILHLNSAVYGDSAGNPAHNDIGPKGPFPKRFCPLHLP
jgi:hypothetical protein